MNKQSSYTLILVVLVLLLELPRLKMIMELMESKSVSPTYFVRHAKRNSRYGKHILLYRLKTLSKIIFISMSLLVLGIQESTLRTWLMGSGAQSRKLHERFFKGLTLAHIQLDELWAKVKEKEQAVWVWTVCEAKTKIIPVMQLGARTQEMAYSVVHELKSRLKVGCVPIFSSDGLKHYFYVLTAHFGEWVVVEGEKKLVWLIVSLFYAKRAQVIKQQRGFRLVGVEHRFLWAMRKNIARV